MSEKIKAIIVDDEKNGREVLKSLLDKFTPEVLVVGSAPNVDEATTLVNELHPDLVFLDIQMPGGSGFRLLQQWNDIPFDVIFVTSFDQYAINAIKYSALDYMLKPVTVNDLLFAVKKAIQSRNERQNKQQQIVALLDNINVETRDKRLAVHLHDKVKLLDVSCIMHITADESYSQIKMISGETYISSKFLKDFEDILEDNKDFLRIHKNCIVNIAHIKEYSKGNPCMIVMEDGMDFEVSRRKKHEVLGRLKK